MDLDTTRAVDELSPITRETDAGAVALAAYGRLLGVLESLEEEDWHRPTDCPAWDVADTVGHVIGAAKGCASMRELARQHLWGMRHAGSFDGNALDATNALQVADHAQLPAAARVTTLRRIAPAAVRGRLRVPRPVRAISIPLDQGGSTAPGMPTHLRLGHLMDVIYSRDTWLHAVDVARAAGRPLAVDPVDRRIVEDVVREWSRRHGRAVSLHLTGPAGGRFRTGGTGVELTLDAIEFCRVLSGRAEPESVLPPSGDGAVPGAELLRTRVLF